METENEYKGDQSFNSKNKNKSQANIMVRNSRINYVKQFCYREASSHRITGVPVKIKVG